MTKIAKQPSDVGGDNAADTPDTADTAQSSQRQIIVVPPLNDNWGMPYDDDGDDGDY